MQLVALNGQVGETDNIGGHNEMSNIDVVKTICSLLNEIVPGTTDYLSLITFVADRPGHDLRNAIDARKTEENPGWTPRETCETGIRKTIQWYIANEEWYTTLLNRG